MEKIDPELRELNNFTKIDEKDCFAIGEIFQSFIQIQSILLDQTNDGNEFSYDIFQKMKE
jgi:hypothetical protein